MRKLKLKAIKMLCIVLAMVIMLGGLNQLMAAQAGADAYFDDFTQVDNGLIIEDNYGNVVYSGAQFLIPDPLPSLHLPIDDAYLYSEVIDWSYGVTDLEGHPFHDPEFPFTEGIRDQQLIDGDNLLNDSSGWTYIYGERMPYVALFDAPPIIETGFSYEMSSSYEMEAFNAGVVTFSYRGNWNTSGTVPADHSITSPGTIQLRQPNNLFRQGYRFDGWWHNGNVLNPTQNAYNVFWPTQVFWMQAGRTGHFVFYAYWARATTVEYRGNGNTTGTVPGVQTANSYGHITIGHPTNLTRPGYFFDGWLDSTNGRIYRAGNTVGFAGSHGHRILYARWIPLQQPLRFEYRSIGHTSGTVPMTHGVTPPATINLAHPGSLTRQGYFFGGWRHPGTGGIWQAGFGFTYAAGTSGAIAFYAHWVRTPGPVVTIPYEIYVCTLMPVAHAEQIFRTVAPGFYRTFGINLVHTRSIVTPNINPRRTSIPCNAPHSNGLCGSACGFRADSSDCYTMHHRSDMPLLDFRYRHSFHTRVFRVVANNLCRFVDNSHDRIRGSARVLERDLIVSTWPDFRCALGTAAHEISHMFGVEDHNCTPNQLCAIVPSSPIYNLWCNRCRSVINSSRGVWGATGATSMTNYQYERNKASELLL